MSLSAEDIKKIAHLARLNLSEADVALYADQLTNIMSFIEQLDKVDVTGIEPMAHSFDITQRMRPDVVTETDQRAAFQAIAPAVEVGLYLVPKVIDAV